jgi:hypothetical protein
MPAPMQSASGYGGLDATPLARPGYFNEIIAHIYERDFLPEITNSDINEEIVKCHQTVQIMKAPEVGPWRALQKNQEMVPNQISAEAVELNICNAAYQDIKIDQLDIEFACDRWDAWEEKFLDEVYESYVKMQRDWVLSALILEADPTNKGAHAGKYGDIDLGSRGNPISVNKDNIALHFANLQRVLMERLRWVENDMYLVLPVAMRTVLIQSNFANAMWVGNNKKTFAIDGLWNEQISGFNIIESVNVPYVKEADGRICYYIIAGHKQAFAYASSIIDGRIVMPERTWSAEYQMLAVWGGKMLYPDAVAVGYWTFSND